MEIDTRKEIRERIRKRYGIAEPGLLPTPTSKDVKEKSNPTYTGEPRGQQPEDNFKMTFFGKTVFSGNLPDWLIGSEKENPDQRLIRAIAEERNKPLTFVDTNAPPYLRKEIPLGITVGELSDELGERKGKLSTQGFENVQGSFRQSTKQLDRGLSGSDGVVGSAVDVAEGLATGIFSALMMPMNFFSPTAQKMGEEMTNLGAPPVVGETFGEYAPNLLYPNPIKLSTAMFISDKINKGVENSLMDSDMLEANKQRIQTGVNIASFLASYYGAGKIGEAGHSLFSKENIPKTIKTAPQEVKEETRINQVNDRAKLKQRLNEIKDVKTKEAIKEKQQIIRDLVKGNEKKVSETKPLEVKPNEVVDTKPETPIGTPKEVTPENNYNQAKQLVDETISLKEKRKERNEHLSDKDEITLSSYKIIKAKLDEGKSASEILDGLHKEYSEKYQELKKRDIEENGELPSDINVSTERINGIKKNPELLIIENAISEVAHSGLFGEGRNNWDYKPKQVTPEVKTIESNVEKPLDQNITISQDKVKTINGESPSTRRSPEINQIRVDKTKDTKSYADIKKVDPDKEVTIYRAIGGGKGRIEAGDFIATDREIAKFYARDILGQRGEGKVTIVSKKVLASEIKLHPDHQAIGVENEFIYRPINPEVQNAKTIRSDEGQVPQGRTTLEGSKSKSSEDLQQPPQEKSGNTQEQVIEVKPIKEFKTEEGKFTNYDISAEHKDRPDMFTVLKDKNGYVIRNAFVPDNIQRQGIATDFYEKMNKESLQETGKPLRSSPAREMPSGEMRVEMTPDAIGLWDSFVEKGLAEKISDRNYKFKEPGTEAPKSEVKEQQSKQTEVKPTGVSTIDRLRKEAKAEPEMTDAQFKEAIKNLPKDKQRTVIINRQIKKSINEGIERNKKAPMGFNPLEYKESIKLGAYHLKNGVTKFADWSAQMIKDLGEKIKPHLLRIWAAIKNLGTDLGKIAIDKIGGIIESKYNPARPLKIVSGDLFRQRFEGIKKISDEVQKSGLEIPEETFLKKVERLFADKLNRGETFIKEAEKIQPISDANNFKMQAELYNGRAKDLIDKRSDSILNEETGFLKRLNNAGLSIDDLGEYLLGRHAKERNSFIETKYKKKNGSGITDIEANKILGKWEDTGIEEFADGMNKMVEQTRQNLLDAGIISQKTYDILKNQYQFYVPLKGTMESIETGSMSKGFSVESTGIKKAKGRQSISDNPVIRIIMDANDADIRIEKNKVMKSFHDFATQFPSDAWNISKRKPFTTIGKNQLGVYINGEQEVITIKDAPLLRGLKNLGVERGLKFLDHFNSYLRAVNTYYNPEFLVNNFTRDAQTALINITGEKSIGLAKKVTKDVPAMMKDIWKGERGGSSKWFSEYKEDGGKMSWLEYKTPQELADTFAKQVRRFQGKGKIKEAFISTEKFISDLNDTIENAFRVSVYKNLRESGMSREQAASYGKGLTVNFNRKGEYGRALNSAYLFWNASMQGSVRILKALGSPRTRKIVAGLAGISAALNLLNRSVDEQGYDNIPDWEKDSNWIFMTGDGKYLKIRQPYGYNVFSVLGNITGDAISGKKDIGELGGRLLSATTDAFNPFGQSGSIGQFFAPTILDPIIQWSENKKFSRAPIRKEQPFFQPKKPNSQLYLQSVRPLSKGFTDWLNKTTGGNEIEQGLLDINPSDVDFWIDFAGGGTGKLISNSINTGTELISKGDFPDIKNIPFVRSNFGSVSGQKQTKSIYDRYNESSRTKFDEEERNKFIKDVQNGILKKEINPDEGKRLIKSFIKGQSNLRR